MKEQTALDILARVSAVITGSHLVYTSGKHGPAYVNKDAIYPHTSAISELCLGIAERFVSDNVDVVVAPAIGGVIISQWVAHHLTDIWARSRVERDEVLSAYAEYDDTVVYEAKTHMVHISLPIVASASDCITLYPGDKLIVRKPGFVIKRGYDKLVKGKRVLIVEDILTTGGSVRKVVQATRALGGEVVGVAALCNRGGITAVDVGDVPKFFSLVNVKLDAWDENDCPLCASGVPINTDVGKGRDFLARRK